MTEDLIPSKTLDDLNLQYVEQIEGYLIVQNQEILYELWCFIDDEAALQYTEEQEDDAVPLLEYETDLYSWLTTEPDIEVLKRQVEHELRK